MSAHMWLIGKVLRANIKGVHGAAALAMVNMHSSGSAAVSGRASCAHAFARICGMYAAEANKKMAYPSNCKMCFSTDANTLDRLACRLDCL